MREESATLHNDDRGPLFVRETCWDPSECTIENILKMETYIDLGWGVVCDIGLTHADTTGPALVINLPMCYENDAENGASKDHPFLVYSLLAQP